MRNPILPALGLAVLATAVTAQCPLVKDINTSSTPFDSNPSTGRVGEGSSFADGMLKCGTHWYFVASSAGTGEELWKTDGTATGTVLVKDIYTGASGSSPFYLTCCNGKVFFRAENATNGYELWMSDGTATGTVMVKDIYSGTASYSPGNLCCLGQKVLFAANDGSAGFELWISDGTATGTTMLKDIRPGPLSGVPQYLKRNLIGTKVYFQANDGVNGAELWVTDGTATGTTMLKDIHSGSGNSSPSNFVDNPGNPLETLFEATDATRGAELWKTDGTAKGTVLVKDIWPGPSGSGPGLYYSKHSVIGADVYFQADNGTQGYELWKTNGTATGTVMVADINPGIGDSFPTHFRVSGTTLFMQAESVTTGNELFKLVGTTVSLVKDIAKGSASSDPAYLTTLLGGKVIFAADGGTLGTDSELWASDGTAKGTVLVKDIWSGSDNESKPRFFTPIVLGVKAMFFAADGAGVGRELFETDGTLAGTKPLKDIYPGGKSNSSSPTILMSSKGSILYVSADDGVAGRELWKTDATGTAMLKDINSGPESSSPTGFIDVWTGSEVLTVFRADNGKNGSELWVTDGTPAGTTMLKDIYRGSSSSKPNNFGYFKGRVFFSALTATTGYELWVTDGTAAGTTMVKDILPGTGSSLPHKFTAVGDTLYFVAFIINVTGRELWKTDGTAAGTVMVKDIWPGYREGRPLYLTPFGNVMLFQANDGTHGTELWKTDGTTTGTVMIKDIWVGSSRSSPSELTRFGNAVYFSASDGINGGELWKTDGTAAGTVMVKDIRAGSGSGRPAFLTVSQGKLFFRADDGKVGTELHVSDGTASGTVMVKDIRSGPLGSSLLHVTAAGDGVYFSADDGIRGGELYFSDGTAANTKLVCDINPGKLSSIVSSPTVSDGILYFGANDNTHGHELHKVGTNPATVERVGARCGSGVPTLDSTQPVLGKTCTFSGTGPAIGARLLVIGLQSAPFTVPGLVAKDCAIWENLAVSVLLPLASGASWSLPVPVPNQPSLVGAQVIMQVAQDPLPLSLSSALQITVGN